MGVPTSEVGYTIATTRRENHEVHKNRWWHWRGGKKNITHITQQVMLHCNDEEFTVYVFCKKICLRGVIYYLCSVIKHDRETRPTYQVLGFQK